MCETQKGCGVKGGSMCPGRLWHFVADMNYDGSVTISDVWVWFKWIFFYPGDYCICWLIRKQAKIAAFLEMTVDSFGGGVSGCFSGFIWLIGFPLTCLLIWGISDIIGERVRKAAQKRRKRG